jgi:hypothetical protein
MSDAEVNRIKIDADNYEQTIQAIIAFDSSVRYDDSIKDYPPRSFCFIGKKMNTSASNKKSPNNEVTPDMIVQLTNDYGFVTEVKSVFPSDEEHWEDDLDQLLKYDDNLTGWNTPNKLIGKHDISLLVHNARKKAVKDYITNRLQATNSKFDRKFSIVAYTRNAGIKLFVDLEKYYGEITDTRIDNKLLGVSSIPIEKLIPQYNMKFYDAKPPLAYLMHILWDFVISNKPSIDKYIEAEGKKSQIVEVLVNDLASDLRCYFSGKFPKDTNIEGIPEIPRIEWVREALDCFQEIGMAEKINNEKYLIVFRRLRKSSLDYFAERLVKLRKKKLKAAQKTHKNQMGLFKKEGG